MSFRDNSSHVFRSGRANLRYTRDEYTAYINSLLGNLSLDDNRQTLPPTPPNQDDAGSSEKRAMKIYAVEFYAKNNALEHHTDRYELVQMQPANLVLRRGHPFYLAIRFDSDRDFDHAVDTMKLVLNFGPNPIITKGTKVELTVGDNTDFLKGKAKWEVRVHHNKETIITLEINIPATVCVGLWKCEVITGLKDQRESVQKFSCNESIYIIFNPWCKEDSVYMENEDERNEYVLNDVGKVYMGTAKGIEGKRWIFAQFDDIVLPCCAYILELTKLDFESRGNVVKVARAISAAVNHNDDGGVVEGRWDGDYKDGVAPWDWTGSLRILEQYMKTGKPVKYGQCWVFSGVTTTICRALGIPCRSVSNFVSAHDQNANLTIDQFFDKSGNLDEDKTIDSIWNYHVWNDVWMARRDLPVGYGGWQAIDATPQETSEGVFQAGPASLMAIIRGEIGFQYDTQFLFSEVNADVIHWLEDNEVDGGIRQLDYDKYDSRVGVGIYTKKVGVFDDDGEEDRENISDLYKSAEGSEAERLTMMNAARAGGLDGLFDLPTKESQDVVFDLIDIDRITIGDPFSVKVQVENMSDEPRTVYAILSTSSVYYTGVQAKKIKKVEQTFTLEPRQQKTVAIDITADEYLDKLVEYSMVKIYAIAIVTETKQTWSQEDDFSVDKPKLELQVGGPYALGREFDLMVTFTNPLKRPLLQGFFTFEITRLARPRTVYIRDVGPGETFSHSEKFPATKSGEMKIVVNFSSDILKELNASKTVTIAE